MATYAIGDVQGCLTELQALLARIGWSRSHDRLWLVGDLVNRGPRSLETLRFVRALGDDVVAVLGNHDLHLLATAHGARPAHDEDTFGAVLAAPDRDDLLEWLRHRPLLHRDRALGYTMVHAGLPPQWTVEEAEERAREMESALQGPDLAGFLRHMYGNRPDLWDPGLTGMERLRFITNAFTRMRFCDAEGRILLKYRGVAARVPWYAHPARRSRGERIVFGHWSTLRLDTVLEPGHGVYHLDDGCVWGQRLRALRLEDEHGFHVPCTQHAHPD